MSWQKGLSARQVARVMRVVGERNEGCRGLSRAAYNAELAKAAAELYGGDK